MRMRFTLGTVGSPIRRYHDVGGTDGEGWRRGIGMEGLALLLFASGAGVVVAGFSVSLFLLFSFFDMGWKKVLFGVSR